MLAIDLQRQNREALKWILNYSEYKNAYISATTAFSMLASTNYSGMPHCTDISQPTQNKAVTLTELEHKKQWIMTIEQMERTLSEKRKAFLEFRRRADTIKENCDVGRPGWVDYVQARYADWHDVRYGYGYPPSKQTMCKWMNDIVDVTVRIGIKNGVL